MQSQTNAYDTVYVNIFGAPGAGKSTLAAYLFNYLKKQGVSVQLVTQFAKDMYWDGMLHLFRDPVQQMYIGANQLHRLNRLNGNVQYVITDAPILLSAVYASDLGQQYVGLVTRLAKSYNRINILIRRPNMLAQSTYAFQQQGRAHTQQQSDQLQDVIQKVIKSSGQRYCNPHPAANLQHMLPQIILKECLRNMYVMSAQPLKEQV